MSGLRLSLAFFIGIAPLGACPNISFVNPVAAGSPTTMVTVIGTGFAPGDLVSVVAPPTTLTTQFVNPTELIIFVPPNVTVNPAVLNIQDQQGVCAPAPGQLNVTLPVFGLGDSQKTSNPAGGIG